MKKLAFAAVMATVVAGPALAQGAGNLGASTSPSTPAQGTVADPNRAPNFTQGSGSAAGGPARELNSETALPKGAGTAATSGTSGTVSGSGAVVAPGGSVSGTPGTASGPTNNESGTPRTGSGQQSGGPAPARQ